MAQDGASDLNDLMGRINAADHSIDQAREQIAHQCDALGKLFTHPSWDQPIDLPDIDHSVTELHAAVTAATQALEHRIGATIDHGIAMIDHAGTELETLDAAWSSALAEVKGHVDDLANGLEYALKDMHASFEALRTRLTEAGEKMAKAGDALNAAFAAWQDETAHQSTEQLVQRFTHFLEHLRNTQLQKVDEHLGDARDMTTQAIDQLIDGAQHLVQDLGKALGEAISQLQEHVSGTIHDKLEEAVSTIIETAVRELLQSIMESIATSEIGVEITAGMAPILPELIAIKKITDAILQAIHLWKDTIGRLGDLSDIF